MSSYKIGLIGCGQMGSAILKGIAEHKPELAAKWYICDVNDYKMQALADRYGAVKASISEISDQADMILLAVKPNHTGAVLQELAENWKRDQFLVSIAAGVKVSTMEKFLPEGASVIRVMPNMPTMAGEGMAVLSPGSNVAPEKTEYVEELFNAVGKAKVLPENYMDAVTAVSGSGPAYVFLMAEAFIEAAVAEGLSFNDASLMVLQTLKGSVALMEQSGEDAAILKHRICSPGGTTIAAVRKLEANGFRQAFFDAVEAAAQRSRDLG